MMSHVSQSHAPITHLRSESEASYLIVEASEKQQSNAAPIGEIEVKSNEQPHMSLGNYDTEHSPKGFAIHFSPKPERDTIVTQMTSLGTNNTYELVLHIANYGNKTVSAEVWQIQ